MEVDIQYRLREDFDKVFIINLYAKYSKIKERVKKNKLPPDTSALNSIWRPVL